MHELLLALEKKLEGEVAVAKANVEVYLKQSVGIGEHPDLVGAIEDQIVKLAEAQEKLDTLRKHFVPEINVPDVDENLQMFLIEDPVLI